MVSRSSRSSASRRSPSAMSWSSRPERVVPCSFATRSSAGRCAEESETLSLTLRTAIPFILPFILLFVLLLSRAGAEGREADFADQVVGGDAPGRLRRVRQFVETAA